MDAHDFARVLRAVCRNDATRYRHHAPRDFDGRRPNADGGDIWQTPREIAEAALRRLVRSGEIAEAESWWSRTDHEIGEMLAGGVPVSADDTLDPWLCRRAGELSAEDAAALAKLRLHVERKSPTNHDARAFRVLGGWTCLAAYAANAGAVRVSVSVAVTAPTPAAAILACGEALGVSL